MDKEPKFADNKWLEKALDTKRSFVNPCCLWEKELIEYTNKFYRQYIQENDLNKDNQIISA